MKNLLFLFFGFITCPAFSQDPIAKFCNSITSEELRTTVEKLASPEFEGREFSTSGEKIAANYISTRLNELQLKKTTANYQVDLSIPFDSLSKFEFSNPNATLKYWDDFGGPYWFHFSNGQKISIIYAGFGIDHPNYSDYAGIDVKGKTVVISGGQPVNDQGINLVTVDSAKIDSLEALPYKTRIAKAHGASGIIFLQNQKQFDDGAKWVKANIKRPNSVAAGIINSEYAYPQDSMLFTFFNENKLAKLFFTNPQDFTDLIKNSINQGKSPAGIFEGTLNCTFQTFRFFRKTQNVLGFIEGRKKDEVIILGAHYDHSGKTDSTYLPGADDDASGVSALLEIAEAFKQAEKERYIPEKNILFAFWGGEEWGTLGSQKYVQNPAYRISSTSLYLNLDMIGRCDSLHLEEKAFVYVLPIDKKAEQFKNVISDLANRYSPSLSIAFDYPFKQERMLKRGDYYHFSEAGIPSLGFFTGLHPDYHTPSDTPEKLNYANMANIARLGFALVWKEAGMGKR
ncbi:MAG: M20/M25/M40 family metallo-hydrolase [Bacteroidota bacterium]|nr:hypothetical protein [Odoribacter sp.]MDP3643425.1 M20/M25/M40 family metallo-hydrolase [Bacteroidota bacterium]